MHNRIIYPWFKPLNHETKYLQFISKAVLKKEMTMGNKTYQLEKVLKKILKVKHVILTTSGTSALTMAAIALGTNSKTKILCTDMTWIATINPSKIIGSKVFLIDVENKSQRVSFKKLNKYIKKIKPDIVYLVHLNGEPTYDQEFNLLKRKYNFSVVEDAAQAFPVKSDNNSFCGTNYEIGCFSLSMTKLVNMVYGGFCVTNSDKIANKLISIRNNGVNAEPEYAEMELASLNGLNFKPSDLHATIGLANINSLKNRILKIKKIYKIYTKKLKNNKFINFLKNKHKNSLPIYILVYVKNKKRFIKFCAKKGIGLHYNLRSLHETKLFSQKKGFPNSRFISKNIIRLPCGPGYSFKDINKITEILNSYKG